MGKIRVGCFLKKCAILIIYLVYQKMQRGIDMKSNNVGKRIAQLRKQNGWSQIELAEKLNVTDKAVSKWENGGMPSVDLFPKLSKIFNVSIDYLMLGEEEIEEKESVLITDEKSQEIEPNQDDFSVEGLSIEDIELILADQRNLYTETELNLLLLRLEELHGKSSIEKEDLPKKIVCPKCGVEITDNSAKFCEYCNCDFAIYPLEQEEYEEYEEYEEHEEYNKNKEGMGCIGYVVAFLFPIIGLVWGIVKADRGGIIFSIIMLLINIIFSIVLQNTMLSLIF